MQSVGGHGRRERAMGVRQHEYLGIPRNDFAVLEPARLIEAQGPGKRN